MDILQLIDRLEELFNESKAIPLTRNVMVDEDRMLDIIDQMRIAIPEEVKKAQQLGVNATVCWHRRRRKPIAPLRLPAKNLINSWEKILSCRKPSAARTKSLPRRVRKLKVSVQMRMIT